jgi:hypothetical protein
MTSHLDAMKADADRRWRERQARGAARSRRIAVAMQVVGTLAALAFCAWMLVQLL